MGNQDHLDIIRQGKDVWNEWKNRHPRIQPDLGGATLSGATLNMAKLSGATLSGADLSGADLSGADLSEANLKGANLRGATLFRTNLRGASLQEADLRDADLRGIYLSEANLNKADLRNADLRGAILSEGSTIPSEYEPSRKITEKIAVANFNKANLSKANLQEAHLSGALLIDADLSKANLNRAVLHEANLAGANLTGAYLHECNLSGAKLDGANLSHTNLSGANLNGSKLIRVDLRGANLSWATLVHANLTKANLDGCLVYGIAVWDVELAETIQTNLVITPRNQSMITLDNLKTAQLVYLLLNNSEIGEVINTLTTKSVLILGRFTAERKAVLYALKDALRLNNYLPILFDFDPTNTQTVRETVRTLAQLSHFIIADLTDASSIPEELETIIPTLAVPVQPLLVITQKWEFSMFKGYGLYPWVLPIYRYTDLAGLINNVQEKVIKPAKTKAQELTEKKVRLNQEPFEQTT